jgi:SET domain-containing protein
VPDHELVTVGPSPIHGTGVFARSAIDEGTLVGIYRGSPTSVDGTHVLWVQAEGDRWRGIDGTGPLRWLNHSATPNVEFDGPELYAMRPIEVGEELLFHYGDEWADVP